MRKLTKFLGRLCSTSNTKFKLSQENMMKIIESKGITARPAKQFSSELNIGENWNLSSFARNQTTIVPWTSISFTDPDGNITVHYGDYRYQTIERDKTEEDDIQELNSEFGSARMLQINSPLLTWENAKEEMENLYDKYVNRKSHEEAVSKID